MRATGVLGMFYKRLQRAVSSYFDGNHKHGSDPALGLGDATRPARRASHERPLIQARKEDPTSNTHDLHACLELTRGTS